MCHNVRKDVNGPELLDFMRRGMLTIMRFTYIASPLPSSTATFDVSNINLMKRFIPIIVLGFAAAFSSCTKKTTVIKTSAPPGQVKKATGSQSAAPYAPGQVKKNTGSQSAAPYAPGQTKKSAASSNSSGSSNKSSSESKGNSSKGNSQGKKK